jgi:hypothetical protein
LHIVCPPLSVGPQVSCRHPPVPLPLRPPRRFLFTASPSFSVGPGAPQGPRAAPRPAQVTSSSPISPSAGATLVSFRFLIARPPSYELVLLAMSGEFTMCLGCSRCRSCRGSCRSRSPSVAPWRSLCVRAPPSSCALCAPSAGVGSGLWGGSACLGPHRAKPTGFMVGPHRPSAYCMLVGRAQFRPDGHLIIFYFYFDSNSNSNFKNSCLDIRAPKIMNPVPLDS